MARYLCRVLQDPACGADNFDTSRLFAYHQATKHTFHSVRANAHFLDWKNQPNPFRIYQGAPTVELPRDPGFPDAGTFAVMRALAGCGVAGDPSKVAAICLDLNCLSRLLWHSMAISSWKRASPSGGRYSLRVNPSSGNLHPTETYLAIAGFSGIESGLYHYRADLHALEHRSPGAWTQRLAGELGVSGFGSPALLVGLTSIFWREAWKYQDRAYRYCCHDLGHAMTSILLAAEALGLHGRAIGHFADARLSRALGLLDSDEAPMAFLFFPGPVKTEQPVRQAEESFAGIANELSPEEVAYSRVLDMHCATIVADNTPALPTRSDAGNYDRTAPTARIDAPLQTVARRRRSALDFNPENEMMSRSEFEQLVEFATLAWPADWRGSFSAAAAPAGHIENFITLYLYVHRVEGCEPGVYRWDGATRRAAQLHLGDVKRVAAFLSLEQTLGANGCFAVSMIANLRRAAELFGNRGYRYALFEAGAIGQRLYLGAEALGWNATGIGAFYDDDVHRYLGLLSEDPGADSSRLAQQVIYHFAVGRAIPDPRIEAQ